MMKKILVFAVLLLSGCVSATDLTKYPHYDVIEPTEKARLYIPNENARVSKPVQKVMRQYFLTASSKQAADFIVKGETFQPEMDGIGAFFLSGLTFWILPTWSTHENSIPFSLTDVSEGKTISLSNVRVKEREYYGWLLLPLVFASDTYFMVSDAYYFALASAIEEAASLIYNPNSRLYKQEKKWSAPNTPVRERTVEKPRKQKPAPAKDETSAITTKPPAKEPSPEEMDMLW
ncbi:MAG: hypothetical protein J5716_07890 [Alphaproteobacteria bacterium]|nr:hypothetical protein [Alphaproteobacteria bacterium]